MCRNIREFYINRNFTEEVFTGGVLLKKPLLKKFYWRSLTEEILLLKFRDETELHMFSL